MALSDAPRGSTERADELGTYTHYHRRCNYRGCGEELTSRNRYQGYLLCRPCAAAKDRELWHSKPRTALAVAAAEAKREDPQRKHAHSLLESFLNHPEIPEIKQRLLSKLVDLELIARFRYL